MNSSVRTDFIIAASIAAVSTVLFVSTASLSAQSKDVQLDPRQRCAPLSHLTIPASAIGLPTNGATVVSATFVGAKDSGNANGEFCNVLGAIHPIDPTAPDIKFEVNLPSRWNNRMLQMGGGGFDGALVTGLAGPTNRIPTDPTPLALGYVTLGSDSGHEGTGFDGGFALNAEAFANFGRLQIKKTHDVALALIKQRYGTVPKHSYFIGGSQGGHEALTAALFYPADFDGVVSQYPAYDLTLMHLAAASRAAALFRSADTWISPDKMKTIQGAVYGACDELDGVRDGIISNVSECNKVMTLETLRRTLRCADGHDTGSKCLSDGQLTTLQAFTTPFTLPFSLPSDISVFPRLAILEGATYLPNKLGTKPSPTPWPTNDDAVQYREGAGTIRYVITKDLTTNPLTFDTSKWASRIVEVSSVWDANTVDLSQFMSKGGKLILAVGTIDDMISPHNSINYYQRLVGRFGQSVADSFVRFYVIPGFGHGNGVFNARFDSLGALDAWVDRGRAPGTLEAVDANPDNHQRRRPMCVYPAWPRYNGSGDVNAAGSFSCVTSDNAAQTN